MQQTQAVRQGLAMRRGILRRKAFDERRIDWVFTDGDWELVVEVKIDASMNAGQGEASLPERGPRRGLIVLTRHLVDADLPDPDDPRWLGVVRWDQVLPALRTIRPTDEGLVHQWVLLLDVLSLPDDVGLEPISHELLVDPQRGPLQRKRVMELAYGGALEELRDALMVRKEARRDHLVNIRPAGTSNAAVRPLKHGARVLLLRSSQQPRPKRLLHLVHAAAQR